MGEQREDEEGLSYKKGQWFKNTRVKNGKFDEIVFDTSRRPFSLKYRGRAYYEKDQQDEGVAEKIGGDDFDSSCDLRFGDPKNLDAELKASAKDIAADLDVVQRLFTELKTRFAGQRAKYDEKTWKAWKKDWYSRVEKVREKNNDRWELWAAWVERQGRFRIDGFCDMFRWLLEDDCSAFLEQGDEKALEAAQRSMDAFSARFEEAREIVGLDAPFEVEKVGDQVRRYAAAMKEVVRAAEAKSWDSADGPRSTAREAILALSTQKLVPRRGYEHVVRLGAAFMAVLELGSKAGGDAWRKAVDEHDAALKNFMNYAQIKP
jgi:hypothetical protein